jgi:UDP-N-acetylmuramate dehydrogenase
MLLVPDDEDCRSAGSFFKNPIQPAEKIDEISRFLTINAEMIPRFPAAWGKVKLPAAWLLEQAGFHKGYRLGRAGISSKHTLALINAGGATASEILALKNQIVRAVAERFGITLEQEPVMLGF